MSRSISETFEVDPYVVRLYRLKPPSANPRKGEEWTVVISIVVPKKKLALELLKHREVMTQIILRTTDYAKAMVYFKAARRVAAINAASLAIGVDGADIFDISYETVHQLVTSRT